VTPGAGRTIRWLITAAIVVFLVLFARTVNWQEAWNAIRTASMPLLALALAANFASLLFKAVRWWMFLRAAGAPSLFLAARATIAGAGLNNVLVANGGEAARVVFVTRATGLSSSTVLATLALERLFDPVGFVILLVYSAMAFELPPAIDRWRVPAQLALAAIAVLLLWFLYSARNARPADVIESQNADASLWTRIRKYFAGFAFSARSLSSPSRFLAALGLSMLSWIGQVLTFKYAAAAAHVDMTMGASVATLLAINLGLLLRATPGNVGFFQVVFALTAEQFGIGRDDAIAVSLLIQTLQIIPVTLLGAALAPEFIFRKPSVSASVAEESEELARIARKT
jgi:glycosyltransferase 2 family protein